MGDNTSLYSFTSHTFTNAGATGPKGPTLAQIRSAYSGASWASTYVNMTNDNGIQLWTVPATGSYSIIALGAAGGNYTNYGKGKEFRMTTILKQGEIIKILVGQQGLSTTASHKQGGGGGGTFVVRNVAEPIIVAGGGGGAGSLSEYSYSNANGLTNGNQGGDGDFPTNGIGGSNGNGGQGGKYYSGGGGGLNSNGLDATGGVVYGFGGMGFINGGIGGNATNTSAYGGFGGGGGAGAGGGGGGGGGYSGGGGGTEPRNASGGGGGSFNNTSSSDYGSSNTGHGSVNIRANFIINAPSLITVPAPVPVPAQVPAPVPAQVPAPVPVPAPYSSDYLNLVGNLKLKGSSYIDGNLIVNNNGTQVAGISNTGDLMLKGGIVFGNSATNVWRLSADGNNFLIQKSGEQGISITSKGVVTPVLNINTWTFPKF